MQVRESTTHGHHRRDVRDQSSCEPVLVTNDESAFVLSLVRSSPCQKCFCMRFVEDRLRGLGQPWPAFAVVSRSFLLILCVCDLDAIARSVPRRQRDRLAIVVRRKDSSAPHRGTIRLGRGTLDSRSTASCRTKCVQNQYPDVLFVSSCCFKIFVSARRVDDASVER